MTEPNRAAQPPSLWDHKPAWCQPWSILASGAAAIMGSWMLVRIWWLTALVGLAVLLWWGLFLVVVPRAWQQAEIAARSERQLYRVDQPD